MQNWPLFIVWLKPRRHEDRKMHKELSQHEQWLSKQVVDVAYQIHKKLGPGLLEKVYEACFCYELNKRQIGFITQKKLPVIYDGVVFEEGLRLDILIDDLLIVELKAQENYHPVWEAQLLSYLRLSEKRIGFIINFTVPLIKDGIKRMVL